MNRITLPRLMLLLVTLTVGISCTDASTPGATSTDPVVDKTIDRSDAVYERSHLLEVHIELSPSDWQALRTQTRTSADLGITDECMPPPEPIASPFTWFSSKVTVDGEVFENVGIRKKGFIGSLSESKPSLKIRLDKFVDDQTFLDMKRLTLNNDVQDDSHVRQCLAYDLFRSVGTPTPRCNFAHVVVNGQDLGVYTNIESIKKPFLRRNFADPEGNLYEGTLSDFRPNWTGTFNQKTNESEPTKRAIDAIAAALTVDDDKLIEELEKVLDFDAFLNFWAIETLTAHWDGYAGNTNNYSIYEDPTSGKVRFIPWGVDQTFSVQYMLFEGQVAPRSINAAGLITRRLYLSPQGQALYIDRLLSLLDTHWDANALRASIDDMAAVFQPAANPNDLSRMNAGIGSVIDFVMGQADQIRMEITTGPQPWDAPLREDLCGGESRGAGIEWQGKIALTETSGDIEYFRQNEEGEACDMEADLTSLSFLDDCGEACSFAMEMTMTTLQINDENESVCSDEELASDGRNLRFKHSSEQVGEYEGTPVYRLYSFDEEEGGWTVVEGGYSLVFGNPESGYWVFGVNP